MFGDVQIVFIFCTDLMNLKNITLHREKKLPSFLPAHVAMGSGGLLSTLRGRSSRQAGLEQNLLDEYKKISTSAGNTPESTQLLHQYLSTCHTLPYYGYEVVYLGT